ncbi:MAG TPA: hypothetical protein VG796_04090 [Verrucomicrobiales bacterium]|nr:hypothetical protein [Verrucomicrobiales bacterium]
MSSTVSNPREWLILQCQACGSPMKVRAQAAAGSRVSCPVCRSPVVVNPAGGTQTPEFRVDVPRSSPEMTEAARRRLAEEEEDTEFTPSIGSLPEEERSLPRSAVPENEFFQSLKPIEEPAQEEDGKRVRKRRKKLSESRTGGLTDWNTLPLDQLPEAEILADTWLEPGALPEEAVREQERNTVVSETIEDGQTKRRIKKVRRRAIFGFAQLFFRRLSYGVRVTVVVISSIIGIGGLTYAIIVLRQKFKPVDFPDVAEEIRPSRNILASQDESGAYNAVAAFLQAQGVEKKLPLVRLPNRVRPLMEDWYRKQPDTPATAVEIIDRGKVRSDSAYYVKLRVAVKQPDPLDPAQLRTVVRDFMVEEIQQDDDTRIYKVDWEAAVNWRPMSFEEFRQQQPRQPVPFRVQIEGCDYYNHSFSDERRWLSCRLYLPQPDNTREFLFYGYIDRRSQAWNDLAIYTEPGNTGALILALKYPQNAISFDQVIVDSLVHPSWFYTKDVPPSGTKPEGK